MEEYNLAFYTYFYGSDNNTAFNIPPLPSVKYKCYYYTNNNSIFEQLKNTKWIGIFVNKPTNDDLIESFTRLNVSRSTWANPLLLEAFKQDLQNEQEKRGGLEPLPESCMEGKHIKAMPQEYTELKDYDYLCFLDSKLGLANVEFIEHYISTYFIKQNYALLIRTHDFLTGNIWHEYNQSISQIRYGLQQEQYTNYIHKQIKNGLSEVTPLHCRCGFLIRNMKHEKMIEINKTWYDHIQDCGIQDQISFFFVKQLFMDYIHAFKENPFIWE
jgi:hypothetical protein